MAKFQCWVSSANSSECRSDKTKESLHQKAVYQHTDSKWSYQYAVNLYLYFANQKGHTDKK